MIGKNEMEVVVCCLIELKMELKIDRKCVFVKFSLKEYKIGYMYVIIIVKVIVDFLEKRICVLV